MILERVIGEIHGTIKHRFYEGKRLLIVEKDSGDYLIAADAVGAGADERLLVLDEGDARVGCSIRRMGRCGRLSSGSSTTNSDVDPYQHSAIIGGLLKSRKDRHAEMDVAFSAGTLSLHARR
jgi:microcompartment protein CcmK/EutM